MVVGGTVGSRTRNVPWLATRLVSAPAWTTSRQKNGMLRSSATGIRNAVSGSPTVAYTGIPSPARNTKRSYRNGPGGATTAGEVHTSVGIGSAVLVLPGLLSVSGVAQGGTVMGPTTPVVAPTPVADVASTRQ